MNYLDFNSNRKVNFQATTDMLAPQMYPNQSVDSQTQYTPPLVNLPDIYKSDTNDSKSGLKEFIKKMDVMGLIYPWFEHPFLMTGTCAGISFGIDKFAEAFGGEYEKSLLAKAAALGDKISESKFLKPLRNKVSGWFSGGYNKVKNFFKDSDLVNAVTKTPSQGEWTIVTEETKSMSQRVVQDFVHMTQKLKLTTDGFVELSNLGLNKNEKEFLSNFFKNANPIQEDLSNAIQLKRLGIADDEIKNILAQSDATKVVKQKILEKMGCSEKYLKYLAEHPAKARDFKKVAKICDNARGIKVAEGYNKFLGKLQIFERKVGFDEVANRLISATQARTKFGRGLSTFLQKCHRGFTFAGSGSKFGILLFIAPMLVDTMMNVKKADNDQKAGTAVKGLVQAVSWVFTFPIALIIMHHLAGAQYAGMTPQEVARYRAKLKDFNTKAANGQFNTRIDYKKGKDEVKALRKVKDQNLLTRICKKIGSFVTMDLETFKPYKGKNFLMNFARKIPNFLKNVGGIPMRFAIWGAISMGILDAIINKSIKFCFGNYYDEIKEEEHEENKKKQKEYLKDDLKERLLTLQTQKMNEIQGQNNNLDAPQYEQSVNNYIPELPPQSSQDEIATESEQQAEVQQPNNNGLNNVEKPSTTPIAQPALEDTYTYIPEQSSVIQQPRQTTKRDNYTYIPSSENLLNKEEKEYNTNKYIPSQEGAKINPSFDNSGLNDALSRADRAEKRAIQVLSGNFSAYQ